MGVKFYVCQPSLDLHGLTQDDLIDGVADDRRRGVQRHGPRGRPGHLFLSETATVTLQARYEDVPLETKQRLFDEVKADLRFKDYLYGCYECGICVAACPSARFYDFSPAQDRPGRRPRGPADVLRAAQRRHLELLAVLLAALRCPRGNNPGGLITIMREVAINNGLTSAKQALEGYGRVVYKIMSTGHPGLAGHAPAERLPGLGPARPGDLRQPRAVAAGPAAGHDAHDVDGLVRRRQDADRALPDLAHDRRPGHDQGGRRRPPHDPQRRHGRAARRSRLLAD